MRRFLSRGVMLGVALAGIGGGMPGVAQDYPPKQYQPLLFNPAANHLVYRLAGAPFLCLPDSCLALKLDGIADRELPQATITPLGFTERRFYLGVQHSAHARGQMVPYVCGEDGCRKLEMGAGDYAALGNFQVRQGDRWVNRTSILRRGSEGDGRSRIYWCSDGGCLEQAITRDNTYFLAPMGSSQHEGRQSAWLRERAGWVLRCQQEGDGSTDGLACERADLTFPDLGQMQAAAPPQAPPPPLAAAPQPPAPPPLAAAPDNRARIERTRRLIADARRFAGAGDFVTAEGMLQDAAGIYPGFGEIDAARNDIARLRSERDQRFSERAHYVSAIDQAFASWQLWEAERLIVEGERRFAGDPAFRSYRNRLAQVRAEAAWQSRIQRSREHIALARRHMARGELVQADRQLDQAQQLTPGLPELAQARRELARSHADVDFRDDDIRELVALIGRAIDRHQYDDAERHLADGLRRFPGYQGWPEQRRRIAAARGGVNQQERAERARELVVIARREIEQGDFAAADRRLVEAAQLSPTLPEIAAARAELNRQRAERQVHDREVAAIATRIEGMLARNQIDNADRELREAKRRFPNEQRWVALDRRLANAREAVQQQGSNEKVRQLLAEAHAAIGRRDVERADRAVDEAERLAPNAPEVRAMRTQVDRLARELAANPPPARPPNPDGPRR